MPEKRLERMHAAYTPIAGCEGLDRDCACGRCEAERRHLNVMLQDFLELRDDSDIEGVPV